MGRTETKHGVSVPIKTRFTVSSAGGYSNFIAEERWYMSKKYLMGGLGISIVGPVEDHRTFS